MSRRRSTSNAMGPPPDRDVVMGPPPVPAPSPASQKSKDGQDVSEKYRKLKRRFFELEEKHKETSTELQRSGERNVKMREERNILLDRIIELEAQPQSQQNGSSSVSPPHTVPLAQPSSSAFPRTLLNARARTSFIANLRQAIAEDDADDDADPLLTSRHVGPEARRRFEEEQHERLEEESRESRKSGRRPRASHPQTGSNHKSAEPTVSASGQPLLTYTPSPHHTGPGVQGDSPHHGAPASPPVLVLSTGARLRIKPPAPPSGRPSTQAEEPSPPNSHNAVASSSSSSRAHSHQLSPLSSTHSHPHSYTHPPPPPPPHFQQQQHQSPTHSHHSRHQQQRSPTPEDQETFRQDPPSPRGGMNLEMVDDRAPGSYDYSPPPPHPYPLRNLGTTGRQDRDREHRGDENADTGSHADGTVSPTFHLRNEGGTGIPVSASRNHENTGPASGPSHREAPRSRRSSRTSVDSSAAHRDRAEREHARAPPALSAAKKATPSASPATSARLTRSESAALAAAAAAAAAAEAERSAQAQAQAELQAQTQAQARAEPEPEVDAQRHSPQAPSPMSTREPSPRTLHAEALAGDIMTSPPPPDSVQAEQRDVQMDDGTVTGNDSPVPVHQENTVPSVAEQKPRTPSPTPVRDPSPEPPLPVVEDVTMAPPEEDAAAADEDAKPKQEDVAKSLTPAPSPTLPTSPTIEEKQPKEPSKEPSPMENIVKVAEAAVAAQNAANALLSQSSASASSSPAPGQTQSPTSTANQNGGNGDTNSASTSPSTTPTSTFTSAGTNPYMIAINPGTSKPSINTMGPAMPSGSGSVMPSGHVMTAMNPYSLYYPPGTPVTPNTPTYAHPYANPYYYLAATPMAGPSGMYPTSPSFVPPSAQRPPSEVQRHAKPKRLKAHTVTSKSFSIPMVPRDKKGKPMLPLNVGIMTVINLGDVCMREHFHTERYIFPVGYEVTRRYLSTVDASVEVVYHCTILDGGDGPKFQIVPSDVPDRPVIAGTATGAWSNIVKQANAIRNRQHSNSVSGPDFFGLGQNTIKHLIQELPNADRLRDYVWQNFVEGGPLGGRHAAVIPALPEEYDASMPIGAYYPSEREKMKREATSTPESPRGMSHYPQHIVAQAEAQRAQQVLQQAQQPAQQGAQPGRPAQEQQKNSTQVPVHQGVTQIVLPPPTSAESLNFQEYQPPAIPERRSTRHASASGNGGTARTSSPAPTRITRQTSRSPSVRAEARHTRSSSRSVPAQQQPSHHSPYVANNNNAPASSASPPPVPATFASIMNAYPAPGGPGPNE